MGGADRGPGHRQAVALAGLDRHLAAKLVVEHGGPAPVATTKASAVIPSCVGVGGDGPACLTAEPAEAAVLADDTPDASSTVRNDRISRSGRRWASS